MRPLAADVRRKNRWYFGGVSSALCVCVTHPLDTLKVHLQTQQKDNRLGIGGTIANIYTHQGIPGFYKGLTASVFRQLTYATTRFGIYEGGKPYMRQGHMLDQMFLACFAGLCGGIVGLPADVVNVRMQNDMKLPPDKRRNYKHVFDGFIRVYREEGVRNLFSGASFAIPRGIAMTIGVNLSYDVIKKALLSLDYFEDNPKAHFVTSLLAAGVATVVTQPLDVLKTRAMNAKPGEFRNLFDIIRLTAQDGPLGFFKGFVPAFVRIGPQTILTFLLMEQLRLHFGWLPKEEQ